MVRKDINLYARYNKPIGVVSSGVGKLSKMGTIMIVVSLIVVLVLGGITTYGFINKANVQKELNSMDQYMSDTQVQKAEYDLIKASVDKLNKEVSGSITGIIKMIESNPSLNVAIIDTIIDRTYNIETSTDFLIIESMEYFADSKGEGKIQLKVKANGLKDEKDVLVINTFFVQYAKLLEENIYVVEDGKKKLLGNLVVDRDIFKDGISAVLTMKFVEPKVEGGVK